MHISDGILPTPIWAGSYAVALGATGLALRRFDERRIPQVAVMASVFFVASSIAIPLGPASWHLLLNGLVGVVLGWEALPAILLALLLQYLLLGEGGLTSLGANTITMAGGAVTGYYAFRLRRFFSHRRWSFAAFGFLAGLAALLTSGILFYGILFRADPEYQKFSLANLGLHTPLLIIEPLVTAFAVTFLAKVKPDLLDSQEGWR